jgi:hypothetical protein
MLSKQNYTKEHIESLHSQHPKIDKSVSEMTMYAFGLLQSLANSKLDFAFKGGTCLMLLLKEPKRVSADIDILVPPGTEIATIVDSFQHEFPLVSLVTSSNASQGGIKVGHYTFECPHLFLMSAHVTLDVAFAPNRYPTIEEREIKNAFLINNGLPSKVKTPSLNSILGDKLTAFAPKTIGVHADKTTFGTLLDKRLQIIKQLYDINGLILEADNMEEVRTSYFAIATEEREFHQLDQMNVEDFIKDSFLAAFSILTQGKADQKSEYSEWYKPGIEKIRNHIFSGDWNTSKAQQCAAKAMLFYACLLKNIDFFNYKIAPRKRFRNAPYSAINKGLSDELFGQAANAIALFDPKATFC